LIAAVDQLAVMTNKWLLLYLPPVHAQHGVGSGAVLNEWGCGDGASVVLQARYMRIWFIVMICRCYCTFKISHRSCWHTHTASRTKWTLSFMKLRLVQSVSWAVIAVR